MTPLKWSESLNNSFRHEKEGCIIVCTLLKIGGHGMEQLMCNEKHKQVDEKFIGLDTRVTKHDIRISDLEKDNSKFEERLDNLIVQLASLTSTLKWFIGVFAGALVSFFFFAVQKSIF
jgi:hypothetical protein